MPEDRPLSMDSIVSAVGGQLSADLNGEIVILHLESGIYYGLDDIGTRIWNLIQEPKPVSDIRDAILREYDVESAQCERDVLALLGDLEANKLIETQIQSEPNAHPIVASSGSS